MAQKYSRIRDEDPENFGGKSAATNNRKKPQRKIRFYKFLRHLNRLPVRLLLIVILIALFFILSQKIRFFFQEAKIKEFQIHFKNIHMAYWMDIPTAGPNSTCPEKTKLLILIMTRRGAFERRLGLRRTWLKDAVEGTATKFMIADSDALAEQKLLEEEQHQFRDLVFQHGIEDSYANLHLKWLAALHWQQAFCPQAEFIMKTDDDTIVHLPRLDHWVERKFRAELQKNPATYFGWIIAGVGPIRDPNHKWYVPKSAFAGDSYPPYMQGATYVASRQAITAVLKHTDEVAGFNMDDVLFTGILADQANVSKSDHKEMFRVGNGLAADEKCEDGVPQATALYDSGARPEYEKIYAKLKAIPCKN